MSTSITDQSVAEIRNLHLALAGFVQKSVDTAIRIGELLTAQKCAVGHGGWQRWISENLPFSERTARNYMRLYEQRDRVKTANVADLSVAYNLLAGHQTGVISRSDAQQCTVELQQFIKSILDTTELLLAYDKGKGYCFEYETFEKYLDKECSLGGGRFFVQLKWCLDYLAACDGHGDLGAVVLRLLKGELGHLRPPNQSGKAAESQTPLVQ